MKMPELQNTDKYVGLYVVDFGDHSGVGFTAQEVTELLESERYQDIKVYRIHRATPDGQMEMAGVPNDRFQLETGVFFAQDSAEKARNDFENLSSIAIRSIPPGRARLELAQYEDEIFVTALIYPAEYDPDFSQWLLDNDYHTTGPAWGGIEATTVHPSRTRETLDLHQLFEHRDNQSRTGTELLEATRKAVVR